MNLRQLLLALFVVLLAGFGVGAGALFVEARAEYNQLKRSEAAIRRKLAETKDRLAEQERILHRLRNDRDFVEKTLRKRLNYLKPGDVIFQFEDRPGH